MKPITNAWALREVYFDENGDPIMHRKPERKPLTDEEIDVEFDRECWVTVTFADGTRGIALDKTTAKDFARAIEAAHGIKGEA